MPCIPLYDDPRERRAYQTGWRDGITGKARRTDHSFPNAYSKGYWEGVADLGDNQPCPATTT